MMNMSVYVRHLGDTKNVDYFKLNFKLGFSGMYNVKSNSGEGVSSSFFYF